jgi:hypothetical protein
MEEILVLVARAVRVVQEHLVLREQSGQLVVMAV